MKTTYLKCIATFLALLCATAQSIAAESFSSQVDTLFSAYAAPDVPGCAVGVIRNGEYVHAKGYGSANLEHGIPISRDSVFRIGSVSKQFTAAAIAILAVRRELDLDADVHTYLPELRDYDYPVTIRQMVHHLSGMGEYEGKTTYEIRDGVPFRFGNEDYWSIEEFYSRVIKQPLARKPGEQYEYSNIAYFLLGQVVERVSGQSLRQFANDEIFRPLQMHSTFFNDNVDGVVLHRADGYKPLPNGGFEIFMTNLDWVGDGGVYTTLNDFIKWDQAFMSGNVPGGDAVAELMLTPHPTTVATMDPGWLDAGSGYGFGLDIGSYQGHRVHMHTGSWVGFRAFYARFPDDKLSVVTLCNRADAREGDKSRKLVDLALAEFSN
jgi:CubicO group peptidase (beta-lactamase class C family)